MKLERRDYSLDSEQTRRAVAAGLSDADWYRSPIDPDTLKQLTARTNAAATRDVLIYLTLLVASGVWAYLSLWSWWSVPALFVYGTLYGSSSDPRWHECGHGTAFRTSWLNELVYYPASFMLLRGPTIWRWSHVRHHSDTIIVGRDPEIILKRPSRLREWLPKLGNLKNGPMSIARTMRHASGKVSTAERSYIPEREQPKLVWEARAYIGLWLALIVWSLMTRSLLPFLFFVGPSFYGIWLTVVLGSSQHLGLQEDVLDHRLNSRTIYMNPVLRFLYWNMNYHCEHHMFPTVPFHALPDLHDEIKDDLPPPNRSLLAAYGEMILALRHQRKDPTWELPRDLPTQVTAEHVSFNPSTEVVSFDAAPLGDGTWFALCGTADLDVDDVARVNLGDRTFALYRLKEGFFVTDGICTHSRRVHLAGGLVINGLIECPKHNGRFEIASGKAVRAPVCEALGTHETRVEGDRVLMRPAT